MSKVRYTFDELTEMRNALSAILDRLEAEPISGGAYETNTQFRPKGVSIHFKWKPELPVVLPGQDKLGTTNLFAELGCNPILMSQLLDQMVAERCGDEYGQ